MFGKGKYFDYLSYFKNVIGLFKCSMVFRIYVFMENCPHRHYLEVAHRFSFNDLKSLLNLSPLLEVAYFANFRVKF